MEKVDDKYLPRLVDKKIEIYLKLFGAISIDGVLGCGKTQISKKYSKSEVLLDDKDIREMAMLDLELILNKEKIELVDEWQIVPSIWDRIRRKCDEDSQKGKYILTSSTALSDESKKKIFHSDAGKIGKIKMYPMSLFESGDSTGDVSITEMINDKVEYKHIRRVELPELARLIIRGGWPENIKVKNDIDVIPKNYIDSIIDKSVNERKDANKMRVLLKSLARNESTRIRKATLVKDIKRYENEENLIESRATIADYLSVLDSLHLISNQEAFSVNYRSSKRVGKTPKRHLVDPSLACAVLGLSEEKLMEDLHTFGLMFESLVARDLRIYAEFLDGHLYHFRDNTSGEEVDSIMEFRDGSYGAIEIKLSDLGIEEAKKSLTKFYDKVEKKPKFMCIIVGYYEAIIKDKETGIYIVPITSLRP